MPLPAHLVLKKARRGTIDSTLPTPGEFFRDSIPSLHEDPFIPTQLRVSSYHTLTTLLPLDNLTYLDISYNEWLTEIPREILGCSALRKLDISGCRNLVVGRLPGCLAELSSLEWLVADGCDLISIDTEISTLKNLHTLSLKFNRIEYIPPHLARLYPHLKLLALEGNPCYDTLLPKRPTSQTQTPAPPSTASSSTPPRQSGLKVMPSIPRLRHSKSSPSLPRARSRTLSTLKPSPSSTPSAENNPRKSFFRQITPPLPSFIPRRPPRPEQVDVPAPLESFKPRQDDVIGIAKGVEWPVGPTPEPLHRQFGGDRNSDSSEESAGSISSMDGSSPASSISSPSKVGLASLPGSEDVSLGQKEMTVWVLSRLRDLWEVSNGWICLDDHWAAKDVKGEELEKTIEEMAEGLGISLEEVTELEEEKEDKIDVVKKVMGEQNSKRANIVKEIIETEETYIRGLQELVDGPLPPVDQLRIVFRHVKTLLNFHQNFFLPALVQATQAPEYADHPDPVSSTCDAVGTVFEENADFMKMYFEYINNFDEAVRIVEKWQAKDGGDSTGAKFLKLRMQDERHSQLNLLGYLLLPVQRVPRYRLLLADLVNSTSSPSTRLRGGFDKIECLAREINDRKAEMEGRRRLVELEQTVVSPISAVDDMRSPFAQSKFVDPARRLVKEGQLQVVVRRKKVAGGLTWEKNLEQKCLAISCSDKIFLDDGQEPELSLRAEIPLENAIATRCWESKTEWRLVVFDGPVPAPSHTSIIYNSSGGEIWRFRCEKEEDVQVWIDATAKATKRVHGR